MPVITVQQVSGQSHKIELDDLLELSVYEIKCLIEIHWPEMEADYQKLIYRGKILSDDDSLAECKVRDGARLIVVKPKKKKKTPQKKPAPQPPVPAAPRQAPQTQPSNPAAIGRPAAQPNNPFGAMPFPMMQGAAQGQDLQSMQQNMQQQLMQNPEMMQQMMQNPMVQNMMNQMMQNPDMMTAMFDSNPQLRQLMDQNPQLRHVLQDPETMQQAMEAVSNPEVYQEMLRNQDRALANISNMPGGFNALSRMYNSVQAPMEEALLGMGDQGPETTIGADAAHTNPTNDAMPNPFADSTPAPSGRTAPRPNTNAPNPFASMFGAAPPGSQGANPAANQMNFAQMMQQMQQMRQAQMPQQPPAPPANPQEAYASQLGMLAGMGFNNEQENINALIQARGDVNGAVNILMMNRGMN